MSTTSKNKSNEKEPKVRVIVNEEPIEILAQAIIEVSDAFEKINKSSLTPKAIIVLLHNMIPANRKVYMKDIETILQYAPQLKNYYIKPKGE